ncbi:MAG: efflux RND transporter periplasmic adaptor subunit [Deltaproteobacteria bacterium]|nr:efflux RND transporter periplasmic adaptor subunit [Deltaproteobacteria bacterium]
MTSKRKHWLLAILGLLAVVALLAGIKALQIRSMIQASKTAVPPPESVTTAKAQRATWEQSMEAIGTLVAVRGVSLSAEVPGTVMEIAFESGSTVKEGDLLVRLDKSIEEAQLESAQAQAALARLTLRRARIQRAGGANAPADLDAAVVQSRQAEASVASLKAAIAKKTLLAPFDGRISIRQVELGQVVSPGTPVASLQSVTPIHCDFFLPEQALAHLAQGQRTRLSTDTFGDDRWDGAITVINPEVEVATRNVRIRATFENPDGRLRPGMFARAEVVDPQLRTALVIPATSVIYAPYGNSVFTVVEEKDPQGRPTRIARRRVVRLGDRRGDFVAVLDGLEPGETVVSSGAFKLRNDAPVAVNNKLGPRAELSPKPTEP